MKQDSENPLSALPPSPVLTSPSAAPQEQMHIGCVNDLETFARMAPVSEQQLEGIKLMADALRERLAAPSGEAQKVAERLRAFIREHHSGGCKMLSRGSECECPLCDIDRLAASQGVSAPAVAEIEQEMRELIARHADDWRKHVLVNWANRLAALRGEQK